MYLQVLLSFLLSSVALCLSADSVTTTAKSSERLSTISESAILATVASCTAGSVLIVIIPTMIYHKLIRKDPYKEVF